MKRRAVAAGVVVGVVLMAAGAGLVFIGLPLAMIHAFSDLGKAGTGDPNMLAASIAHVLGFTVWGLGIYAVGLVIFLVSLVAKMRGSGEMVRA